MDIKKQTDVELKVLAYDMSTEINRLQNNLQIINQELTRRANQPKKDEKEKPKK